MTSLWQKNEGGATAAEKVKVEGSTQRQKGNSSENAIHGGLMSRGFHSPPAHCLYTEFKPCELYKVFASPSMGS